MRTQSPGTLFERLLAPHDYSALAPDCQPSTKAAINATRRGFKTEGWRLCAVAALAGLLWCVVAGRTSVASWKVPTSYSGDALEILAHIKAAGEWSVVPIFRDHVERLGAPFGAEWSEYPAADDVLLLGLGLLSRLIGLGPVSNLALLIAQMTAAGAFFVAARWLRYRWEWAGMGAVLFAFSFHNLTRGLPHLSLVFTYTVPLALLSCWLVAGSRRLRLRSAGTAWCGAAAVCIGIGNPYNLFLFLQLMTWAVVAQWLGPRRIANLGIGLGAIAVAAGSFLIVNADVWLAVEREGAVPLMARNYGSVERYALKPIELVLPPATHRVDAMAFWGHRYLRWSEWRGETSSLYLGVIGIAGLAGLLALFVARALRRRSKIPGAGLQAIWILGFSAVGGLNSLFALFFGLQVFRATNRYSVFLLALGLFFLAGRLTCWTRNWRRMCSVGFAAAMLAIGLCDQIPVGENLGGPSAAAANFNSDRTFGEELERALPAGAMVFQLPFVEFPEARPTQRLSDYELFRPFLHTTTLRFTYGALKNRARSRWCRDYASLRIPELLEKLETSGFSAIYIGRRGYADNGDAMVAALAAAGRTDQYEGPLHQQVVIRLKPKLKPVPPLASAPTFGEGWNHQEAQPADPLRWAYGPATLSYFNPYPYPIPAHFGLSISGQGLRHFELALNRRTLLATTLDQARRDLPLLAIELKPGINRFDLTTPEPGIRVSEERSRLRAFALHALTFQVSRK